ncbi:unnamed protein product [Closterium sp. NIES-54]
MVPGQQASAVDMAEEGAEDVEEEGLEAATSTAAAGVADTAMTTRTMDAVVDGSTASVIFATRADTCGTIATNSLMDGLKNVLWVPNLAANLISVRRLQKAGMDTSSKGAKTYTARLGERIIWDLHEDRDVYKEMWQIPVVPMSKERQVAESISTKGEAVGSGDGVNGRAKEIESKKCNLGGTSKHGEHKESGAVAQKQHKGEENPKAASEEEYGENM